MKVSAPSSELAGTVAVGLHAAILSGADEPVGTPSGKGTGEGGQKRPRIFDSQHQEELETLRKKILPRKLPTAIYNQVLTSHKTFAKRAQAFVRSGKYLDKIDKDCKMLEDGSGPDPAGFTGCKILKDLSIRVIEDHSVQVLKVLCTLQSKVTL